MNRVIILTIVSIIFMHGKIYGQDFYKLTSKLFFNVDIKKSDTSLISDLKSRNELILKEDTGWTVYGPTDKDGNSIPYFRFSFSSHPYFQSDFKSGGIMIITSNDSKRVRDYHYLYLLIQGTYLIQYIKICKMYMLAILLEKLKDPTSQNLLK